VIASHERALAAFPEEYLTAYRALNRLSARVLARDPEPVLEALAGMRTEPTHPARAKGVNA